MAPNLQGIIRLTLTVKVNLMIPCKWPYQWPYSTLSKKKHQQNTFMCMILPCSPELPLSGRTACVRRGASHTAHRWAPGPPDRRASALPRAARRPAGPPRSGPPRSGPPWRTRRASPACCSPPPSKEERSTMGQRQWDSPVGLTSGTRQWDSPVPRGFLFFCSCP